MNPKPLKQIAQELLPCPFCGAKALERKDDGKVCCSSPSLHDLKSCRLSSVWFTQEQWDTRNALQPASTTIAPCFPLIASEQYGMHFILSSNKEILFRVDWLPMSIVKAVVNEMNTFLLSTTTEMPEDNKSFVLPVVVGRSIRGSIANFEQACLVHIERLQNGMGDYDSAMLDTFCEAVRLGREYCDSVNLEHSAKLQKELYEAKRTVITLRANEEGMWKERHTIQAERDQLQQELSRRTDTEFESHKMCHYEHLLNRS